jgi:putative membrane protein
MIVVDRTQSLRLLFRLRGSILGDIAVPLLAIVTVSVIVTLLDGTLFGVKLHMHVAVFGMLGTVLAIIIGFRTNASYDRYREGRMLWGELLAAARSLARSLEGQIDTPRFEQQTSERRLVCCVIATLHALRHALRGTDPREDLAPWIDAALLNNMANERLSAARLLDEASRELRALATSGRLTDYARVTLQQDLAHIQRQSSGCERLQTTPIPFAYSLLVHRTISVYLLLLPFGVVDSCGAMTPVVSLVMAYTFFGLEAVGSQIEEPFGLLPNDLPLASLCRSLEIE